MAKLINIRDLRQNKIDTSILNSKYTGISGLISYDERFPFTINQTVSIITEDGLAKAYRCKVFQSTPGKFNPDEWQEEIQNLNYTDTNRINVYNEEDKVNLDFLYKKYTDSYCYNGNVFDEEYVSCVNQHVYVFDIEDGIVAESGKKMRHGCLLI